MRYQELINSLKVLAIILVVVSLGLFAFNQGFSLYYKAELLSKPCELCTRYNPNVTICDKIINQIKDLNNFNIPLK